MKILVIQTAFIGDVILSTALIERLYEELPDAKIDFLCRKGNEGVLLGHPLLRKLWIFDKVSGKKKEIMRLRKALRAEGYHTVINVQRFFSSGLLTALSRAKMRIGYDKNPMSLFFSHSVKHEIAEGQDSPHEIDRLMALLDPIMERKFTRPKLYPTKADRQKIEKYTTGRYYTIAPASVWFTKQYPQEKWIQLIAALPQEANIYLLGGPSDRGLTELMAQSAKHPGLKSLAGQLNLLQSAALMQNAEMNFVNDSAPLHLASAVNAPVTAVFCSTLPEFGFTPLSDISKVVETSEKLDCRPCGLHGKASCPKGHFKCAEISVEQLLA